MRCVCLSSVMDIRVLGPLDVCADGTDVTPTSPNQRIVLAVLAAHPDRHVRADTLIDALWGPTHRRAPTARSAATSPGSGPSWGGCIVAGRGGFCLHTNEIQLDSTEIERRVASAKQLAAPAAADALRSAIDSVR